MSKPSTALPDPERPPRRSEPLHVGRPNLPDLGRYQARVAGIFERRWLTNDGPLVREFESQIAALTGARHAIVVCNATIGLEIAVRAAGLRGGEVIIPAFTFAATAHCLSWQGIQPVCCDIDPLTHCLDPSKVEALITPRTTGILGVHVWGNVCDVTSLTKIAQRYQLKLLFDSAHAIGCRAGGQSVGNFGEAEVFSFHATKMVNSGEGGAIVTNNDELAQQARLMRNFGFAGFDNVVSVGTNGKMNELSAALGLGSLEQLPELLQVNRQNLRHYREVLSGIPGLTVCDFPDQDARNDQYVVAEIDPSLSPLTRDQVLQVLHSANVLARRYFYPCIPRMAAYQVQPEIEPIPHPVADRLSDCILIFPTGTAVNVADIEAIGQLLRWAWHAADTLRPRLAEQVPCGGQFSVDL